MDASASGLWQLSVGARIEILEFFLKSFLVAPGGCSREWFPVAIYWDKDWNISFIFKKKGYSHFTI